MIVVGMAKKWATWCSKSESDGDAALFQWKNSRERQYFLDSTMHEGLSNLWSEFSTDVRV